MLIPYLHYLVNCNVSLALFLIYSLIYVYLYTFKGPMCNTYWRDIERKMPLYCFFIFTENIQIYIYIGSSPAKDHVDTRYMVVLVSGSPGRGSAPGFMISPCHHSW